MTSVRRAHGLVRTGEVGNAGQCPKCDQWVLDGPDSCIGRLPGVTAACCGHGYRTPYVAFGVAAPGFTTIALYGPSAAAYFDHVKAHPGESFLIDAEAWTRYEPGLAEEAALATLDVELLAQAMHPLTRHTGDPGYKQWYERWLSEVVKLIAAEYARLALAKHRRGRST